MSDARSVFYISDRTGITAETLGQSLLTQFALDCSPVSIPFTDSPEAVDAAIEQIEAAGRRNQSRPIVFSTIIDAGLRNRLRRVNAVVLDFFDTFIGPLESELGMESSHTIGRSHGIADPGAYKLRIDAMNYALSADDGAAVRHYEQADVILVGVSRCGKTPTCIYMALQYGIYAANYPLTDDDLLSGRLPEVLRPYRSRVYALTIRPERLAQIRAERRANTRYASLRQCQYETVRAEGLFHQEKLPFSNTTTMSIEEIAAMIIQSRQLRRRLY